MTTLHHSAAGVMLARGLGLASGFALTVAIAYRYGSDRLTDLAFAALVIPNALAVVASSILPPVLLSVQNAVEARTGRADALAYARSVILWTGLLSLALALLGVMASPWLARRLGVGDAAVDDLVRLLRPAFFIAFFTAVGSSLKGFLNASGIFFLPSLDLLVTNVAALAVIFALPPNDTAFAVVVGMIAGSAAKLLVVAPGAPAIFSGGLPRLSHPALAETRSILLPVLLNSLVHVLNVSITRALAARIPLEGALSHLTFSDRLVTAPHDLVIASLGSVLLASMSRKHAEEDLDGLRRQVTLGLRVAFWFGIPAAAGLFLLAEPIVALVFQHGRFDARDTVHTALALRCSAFLLAFSGVSILAQAFYALRATRQILVAGVAMAAINLGLGFLLVERWQIAGLAFAGAASTAVGMLVSLLLFLHRAGPPDFSAVGRGLLGSMLATGIMAGGLYALAPFPGVPVLVRIAAGIAVFATASKWLCPGEWALARRLWTRTS